MLTILLRTAVKEGTCRINGQPTEYRVFDDRLEIRKEGEGEWTPRPILMSQEDKTGTQYFCD